MTFAVALGLALAAGSTPLPPSPPTQLRASAAELIAMAEAAERHGDGAAAERLLAAMFQDPSAEVRSEARFRVAKLLVRRGRTTEAAVLLRRVVDDHPRAAQPRLELAALLELRALRTVSLPPAMARFVDRWSAALQADKPFGMQVELAIAPDSNINRATRSETLGTVIGDFVLDDSSKERSGIGAALRGAAHGRLHLARQMTLVARAAGDASLYRDKRFNDITAELSVGPEMRPGRARLALDLGMGQQWHGMKPYQRSLRAAGSATFAVDSVSQARLDGALRWTDNRVNDLQDGRGWSLRARYERSMSPQLALSVSLALDRFDASDDAYSTRSWVMGAAAHRDIGRMTFSAGAEVGRLKGDERLALLPEAREELFTRFSFGAVARQFTVAGFAPMARVSFERNRSNVAFYDYRRTRTEFGVSRAF
jgi:hypothetical protein